MCGIAGIFHLNGGIAPADCEAVKRMNAAQIHRGPDGAGFHSDAYAAIGHRRLSIIDLSDSGLQPMCNEDRTVWIVFNGEIYNHPELRAQLGAHSFASQSDTEAILHGYEEWGFDGLLKRLRGMFALAIYDARNRVAFLARDRFGIKPLYYRRTAETVAFASEVKALAAAGLADRGLNPEALTGFLLFGSVPEPLTYLKGIECLPPGHYLRVDPRGAALQRYWNIETAEPGDVRGLLREVVRGHLLADVPLGVFLSGGVDSAGLVSLARRVTNHLRTLTVVFDEAEYSEAGPAREIAASLGAEHEEVRFTAGDFTTNLPAIFAAMDQPTNDGLNTWVVSRAARQAGLKVVLSGLGGDELFWGYPSYRWLSRWRRPLGWLAASPRPLRNAAASMTHRWGTAAGSERWMRLSHFASAGTPGSLYLAMRGFFAPSQVASLLGLGAREVARAVEMHAGGLDGGIGVESFNRTEFRRYLHDQLLRDSDVFSMANSIELRVPYLDHLLVSAAVGLPAATKLARLRNKPALVDAVGDPVVSEAAARPKRGFTFPFARWMKEQPEYLRDLSARSPHVDRRQAAALWSEFEHGRLHWSRAWALAVVGALHGRS